MTAKHAESVEQHRWGRSRRIRRHLLLGLFALAVSLGIDLLLNAEDLHFRLSMTTAYSSLVFLAWSMSVGPWRVLRGRHSPANILLRRDLGIWAGVLGLVHAGVGLTVHFRGDMWKYFFYRMPSLGTPLPLRHDAFGAAVYTGTLSALVLFLLLGLSNNWSLRLLGTRRWKSLQRWAYAGFALMLIHGIAFQLLESRTLSWAAGFGTLLAGVVGLQGMAFYVYRKRHET